MFGYYFFNLVKVVHKTLNHRFAFSRFLLCMWSVLLFISFTFKFRFVNFTSYIYLSLQLTIFFVFLTERVCLF